MVAQHTDEKVVNGALGAALDARHPRWEVAAEQTKLLLSAPRLKLDLLIIPEGTGLLPLAIETEFAPARSVEADAFGRLGHQSAVLAKSAIARAVAVRLPAALQDLRGQALTLAVDDPSLRLEWCVLRQSDSGKTPGPPDADAVEAAETVDRWPTEGWLTGNVEEFSRFCELLLVDDEGLLKAAERIEGVIDTLTSELRRDPQDLALLKNAAEIMQQEDNEQTTKMALTMVANAFVFERAIEGTVNPDTGKELPVSARDDNPSTILDNWQEIIDYNYWPIFHIASQVLDQGIRIKSAVREVIPSLVSLADDLSQFGVTATGDIAGQLFGKLISDRKYLATFYTLPPSAYLMAELVASKLDEQGALPAADGVELQEFRFADLACGTGALLTSLYQRVAARVRSAGNDDAETHQTFMEKVVHAADVMPASAHLTATLLASTHPRTTFHRSNILLLPYGRQSDRDVRVGSLEMLEDGFVPDNLLAPDYRGRSSLSGGGANADPALLGHGSLDACVMNPPFTSNTSDRTDDTAPMPSFAGLANDKATQQAMKARQARLSRQRERDLRVSNAGLKPARDGNAGLASDFIDLADAKLKDNGVIGLILPQAMLSGDGWQDARELLMSRYDDITVLTIASSESAGRAFSADTHMGECMIVARRVSVSAESSNGRKVTYATLRQRPRTLVEGVEMARRIVEITDAATMGTSGDILIGREMCGTWMRDTSVHGRYAAASNTDLVTLAHSLASGLVTLPRLSPIEVPVVPLADVGDRGPVVRDIGNWDGDTDARGPLLLRPAGDRTKWRSFTYQVLWSHDYREETQLEVLPNADGRAKRGLKTAADTLWNEHATRLHFSRHFQLNSQALSACLTPEPSLGGGWPTFRLHDPTWEPTAVLWHNTTIGLISWWLYATRQQQGRAILTVGKLPRLPTLNYTKLSRAQHDRAQKLYERFTTGSQSLSLLPASEAYRDEARHELDRAVLAELLEVPLALHTLERSLDTLRHQWCSEPSVHGGKATQP